MASLNTSLDRSFPPTHVVLLCSDVLIQYTAITWLKEFVGLSGPSMLSFVSGILSAVLPCLAYDDEARISILNCVHQN